MKYNYSLIIPHYNIPHLLKRLLKTIPQREDLQIIVVDDCSTDLRHEFEQLKQTFTYVEWYDTGTNGGGGKARNIGLTHAQGRYLIFADADDYFNPGFEEALDHHTNDTNDLIFFAATSVDSQSYQPSSRGVMVTAIVNKFLQTGHITDIKHKHTAPWCRFIKRRLVMERNIRFQECPVYNDMRFCQMVDANAKTISADANAIYCVTFRQVSVSSVSTPQKEILKMKVMSGYCDYARKNKIPYKLFELIGPTYTEFKKNGWSEHLETSIAPWLEIGVSKQEITKAVIRYRVHTGLILPLLKIRKFIQNF